jgi:hypothetical protein
MSATNGGILQKIGIGGMIGNYAVLVIGDVVMIERDGAEVVRLTVEGLGQFATGATRLRLGWGQFPDGAEVVYLYDAGDYGFGFAVNLACDWCSEWGYAPFR